MFTEKHQLTSITGIELDRYLDKGWYRLGQLIFTTHFLFFGDNLYSPVWIRLPLSDYAFRKSLRKIKRNVEKNFRVEVRSGFVDSFKEELYQKFRHNFDGFLPPTLTFSLLEGHPFNIYNSMNVEVYHGKKLIAYSFFDVGEKSIASISAVYDPAYSNYSLGIYTLIREIEFGLDNGFEYYYPGYVVPGYGRFDYKLRVGKKEEVEFYNLKTRSWLKYSHFSNENIPVEILSKKLTELGLEMAKYNIACQILYYQDYDVNLFGAEKNRFIESPLFLNVFIDLFQVPKFIVYYDIWKEKFVFCNLMPIEESLNHFDYSFKYDPESTRHFLDYIFQKTKLIETKNIQDIVIMALNISSLLKRPLIF